MNDVIRYLTQNAKHVQLALLLRLKIMR